MIQANNSNTKAFAIKATLLPLGFRPDHPAMDQKRTKTKISSQTVMDEAQIKPAWRDRLRDGAILCKPVNMDNLLLAIRNLS